ncbi:uncharacterized protein MELLADRAFT_110832 [Melampsora larici-populina 98AG31]|uniref:Uncharacterized protein n=1 Tax=Melampsora larici-populina (strain 98AG31 / pathotype 3-4-7) TaxID=747676 RepID=F4S143_MELLP|nr:uncharacterized protein MELLADRAFT_110832 [Melampsora larici-populina 98AG31]EGG01704.1 hypothetical protein MELLADRAFT_110832 [Melampsora larici-populina 98AG31]
MLGTVEFTSSIWADDELKASWASLKTLEAAATHCLQTPSFQDYSERAKAEIFRNSDKQRLDLLELYNHKHKISKSDKNKEFLVTPWRKMLRIFMGVYFVVVKKENFEEISTLESLVMKNTPIKPLPSRSHQPGNLYKEFISHIMARLGERIVLTILIRSLSSAPVHNIPETYQSISRLLTPEAQYGTAFTKYMRFIDMAERLVLAGIKNVDLIKSFASMGTKEVERFVKPLKWVRGFDDLHEILFHRGVLGDGSPTSYFTTAFQGEEIHTVQLIKSGFQRMQYLAPGKMMQILNNLQGIQSGQVEFESILGGFKMLKSWDTFSEGVDDTIGEKKIALSKIAHMIAFAIQSLEDENEHVVFLHMVECFLGELKPLKDINSDLIFEHTINTLMFFFLIKEVSTIVGSLITLEDINSVSGNQLFVLQSIQFFQAILKSTLTQTNQRRRAKYLQLNQSMHSEIGKIYRVYLSLTHHFNNLSAMAHGQLLTEYCIQNLKDDIKDIQKFDTKKLAYASLFRNYDREAQKEKTILYQSQKARYSCFLSSIQAFPTKETRAKNLPIASISEAGSQADGGHIQKKFKLFGSFIPIPDTFSGIQMEQVEG